jgi:hypothetical protein
MGVFDDFLIKKKLLVETDDFSPCKLFENSMEKIGKRNLLTSKAIRQCFLIVKLSTFTVFYTLIWWTIYIGSPMVCDLIWFISNELCVFYPWALARGRKHIMSWIEIISNLKPWEILFITYYIPIILWTI